MKTGELLQIAQGVLASTAGGDEFVDHLSRYTEAFELWRKTNEELLAGGVDLQADNEFMTLTEVHAKIFDLAEAMKNQTGKDLRGLKKRGKGIIAYTDILPKRISMRGMRRG